MSKPKDNPLQAALRKAAAAVWEQNWSDVRDALGEAADAAGEKPAPAKSGK